MQIRCPHCHNPIEVVNDDPSGDVSCPSCGSCFNLAKDVETARYVGAGRRLGNFQLIDLLGQGAFGEVWKARDTELDRLVAVKIPRNAHLNPEENEKFLREARAAAQVQHPNIVSVHEVGREDGLIYIAADFVDGASLDQWIAAQPLTVRESVELCAKVADALHHAHEAGVVHRDLKPQNILVDTSGEPHVTDFGLAKRDAGEITMTVEGQILGTPAYMPPEQARGEAHQADRRSDVYSLGVVLFRLLTGELPFRGQRQMLIVQILKEEPPPPRKLNARIPRDVETICLKCLEKDPARRYPSAAELSLDLRRWMTGHPILARPVSQTERLARWCRRNPTIAAMTTAITLLLVIGTGVSTYFAFEANVNAKKADDKANDAIKAVKAERDERERADENAKTAKRNLYAAHMNLAGAAWGRVGEVVRLLEPYRLDEGAAIGADDLRGFEWYYWNRLAHSYLMNLEGHTDQVWGVAFSPNGTQIASAGSDRTVRVWNAFSGQEVLVLKGHTSQVQSVVFDSEGRRLASASWDKTAKVWDAASGQELLTLNGHSAAVMTLAFSADGKRIATGSGNLGSDGVGEVKIWDSENGDELISLAGHPNTVCTVAFSPNGERLASASRDQTVKVWDAKSGEQRLILKTQGAAMLGVAYSADGSQLATGASDGAIGLWDATTGHKAGTIKGHRGAVFDISFRADGKRLLTASADTSVGIWDNTRGQRILDLKGHNTWVRRAAYSPDGLRVASVGDRTIKVWDADINAQEDLFLKGHTSFVTSISFSPDGKWLASASRDKTVRVWDVVDGLQTLVLNGHLDDVNSVAISPDGKSIASGSRDRMVKIWDTTSGQEKLSLDAHAGEITSIAFSADGSRIASGSLDKTVKIWHAETGEAMTASKELTNEVHQVAFSQDGRWLAAAAGTSSNGSEPGEVKVFDAKTGLETFSLRRQETGCCSVAFSLDGTAIASGGFDGMVKLWNTGTRQERLICQGQILPVVVAFSPDGKRLLTGCIDGRTKLWDTVNGQETLNLIDSSQGPGHVVSVAFSSDGRRMAWAGGNRADRTRPGIIRIADARDWTPELRIEQRAVTLIRLLVDQGRTKAECLDAITNDQSISELVRKRALQFAREWN